MGEAAGTTHAAAEADTPRASFISSLAPAPGAWNTASAGDGDKAMQRPHDTKHEDQDRSDFNLPDEKPAVGTHEPAAAPRLRTLHVPLARAHTPAQNYRLACDVDNCHFRWEQILISVPQGCLYVGGSSWREASRRPRAHSFESRMLPAHWRH